MLPTHFQLCLNRLHSVPVKCHQAPSSCTFLIDSHTKYLRLRLSNEEVASSVQLNVYNWILRSYMFCNTLHFNGKNKQYGASVGTIATWWVSLFAKHEHWCIQCELQSIQPISQTSANSRKRASMIITRVCQHKCRSKARTMSRLLTPRLLFNSSFPQLLQGSREQHYLITTRWAFSEWTSTLTVGKISHIQAYVDRNRPCRFTSSSWPPSFL